MSDTELGFWLLVFVFGGTIVGFFGYGIGIAIQYLLEHRADRIDAKREHELELEREKTKQMETQRLRDNELFQRASDERSLPTSREPIE